MYKTPLVYQYLDNPTMELDYSNTTVKKAYDELPPIAYPLTTVQEIENTENSRFTDNEGQHISNNAYQIECLSKKRVEISATESAELMLHNVDKLLTGPKYKLTRIGNPSLAPLIEDKNIIRIVVRYSCSIDLDKNIIYKRS